MLALSPDPRVHLRWKDLNHTRMQACFSCWTCGAECPVNVTNRLNPTRLVRMAALGFVDELLESPDIWYCLSCNRCSNVCPMTVKPAALITYLQGESIRRGVVSPETAEGVRELQKDFQRVRLHAASVCLKGEDVPSLASNWDNLAEAVVPTDSRPVIDLEMISGRKLFRKATDDFYGMGTHIKRCYTCYQCTNACPVCLEQRVFSPLSIFRLANMGMGKSVLTLPSLWLCIQCQSCTRACCEGVMGHIVIKSLRDMALREGYVSVGFLRQWESRQKGLYDTFLDRIDVMLAQNARRG
jgi:heterodisulfide reductase subunit C